MATWTDKIRLLFDVDTKGAKGAFKEVEDAGKEFADSLHKAADKVDADLKNIGDISNRLAQELGDDFRTVAGDGVQALATKMNAAGITMDDLEGNIDGIVSGLRRLEDQADQTGNKMDDIGTKSTKAGDATRSMAGNAVGDMAAATTGVGILGESVGQLTEGLLEGGVGFKQMLGAGLAMGAVALVMKGLSDRAKDHAEAQRIAKESVDGYRQAILKTKTPLEAMSQALEDAGEVILRLPYDMTVDVTGALTEMGLSAQDMARIMDQGQSGIDAWAQKLKDSGVDADKVGFVTMILSQQLEDFDTAAESAAITQEFLAESVGGTHEPLYTLYEDLGNQKDLLTQLDDLWSEYWKAMDNAKLAEEVWASMSDTNMSLEDRVRLVGEYVQEVLGMPPGAMDRFVAKINAGDLDAAYRYLQIITDIKNNVLQMPDMWYAGELRPSSNSRTTQGYASGTMSAPAGLALVGERGPELVAFGGGERVFNAGQTASMLNGAGTTVNVTVNVPPTANPVETGRAVADALAAFYRNGGQRP